MESDCYSTVTHTKPGASSQQSFGATAGQTCANELGSSVYGRSKFEPTGASAD
jgi:hypothetical protein